MPTSARDTTSYRVRVSAPGEQVDPGSLAAVAVDAAHDLASFDDRPTAWNLRKLQRTAVKLHTIVFVVAVRTAASVQHRAAVSLFQPGTMRGTAYVYSARERRIRCAGAIDITNRDSIRYTYTEDLFADQGRQASADRALADDLDDQLIAAIATSLHAVD
jgi:hypothetical protein